MVKYRVMANSRTISRSKALKPSAKLLLVDDDFGKKVRAIKVADAAIRQFGCIDLLVNNAGIYIPKPFTKYAPGDFETMIGTNIGGYFFITQQAVAQMRKRKSFSLSSSAPRKAAPLNSPVFTEIDVFMESLQLYELPMFAIVFCLPSCRSLNCFLNR